MLDFITSDPKFSIASALAVLSITLAIIFYYRSMSIKAPCFERKSKTIVDPKLVDNNPVKVTFHGKPVKTLTMTYLALWNNGRATISRDDIASRDPLRIVACDECHILAADIIHVNRPANNFKVSLDRQENIVTIDFDFIDYKNGAVVRVYHTGTKDRDIDIVGTIKGANGILNVLKRFEFWGNLFGEEAVEDRFNRLLSRVFLDRLFDMYMKGVESQNLILRFFAAISMFIIIIFTAMPLFLVMVLAYIPLTLIFMLYAPFHMWRYRLPEELSLFMEVGW